MQKYKYISQLVKGDIIHIDGIPHEVLTEAFVGTNTNMEAVRLGSMSSPAKVTAAKENGKRGGRPKKTLE